MSEERPELARRGRGMAYLLIGVAAVLVLLTVGNEIFGFFDPAKPVPSNDPRTVAYTCDDWRGQVAAPRLGRLEPAGDGETPVPGTTRDCRATALDDEGAVVRVEMALRSFPLDTTDEALDAARREAMRALCGESVLTPAGGPYSGLACARPDGPLVAVWSGFTGEVTVVVRVEHPDQSAGWIAEAAASAARTALTLG